MFLFCYVCFIKTTTYYPLFQTSRAGSMDFHEKKGYANEIVYLMEGSKS